MLLKQTRKAMQGVQEGNIDNLLLGKVQTMRTTWMLCFVGSWNTSKCHSMVQPACKKEETDREMPDTSGEP